MIVAVVAVGVVQVAIHQVINMIAVGNRGVATIGAVLVTFFVTGASVLWRAT